MVAKWLIFGRIYTHEFFCILIHRRNSLLFTELFGAGIFHQNLNKILNKSL